MRQSSNKRSEMQMIERPWFKSSRSGANMACVEVRFESEAVLVRDSKHHRGLGSQALDEPTIRISVGAWLDFLDELGAAGQTGANGEVALVRGAESATFLSLRTGTELTYTGAELAAFVAGVEAGEFTPELAAA